MAESIERDILCDWIASYSGCDGGDPANASIWLVGIEWGTSEFKTKGEIKSYYTDRLIPEIKQGKAAPHEDEYILADNLGTGFSIYSTKLLLSILGKDFINYKEEVKHVSSTEVFKANLFPIALPDTTPSHWEALGVDEWTGIDSRQEYEQLCFDVRGAFFRNQINKYSPKLILCTSDGDKNAYLKYFCDDGEANLEIEEIHNTSPKNNTVRYLMWKWINDKTLLVITYFPGNRYGINSHELVEKYGSRIKQLMFVND